MKKSSIFKYIFIIFIIILAIITYSIYKKEKNNPEKKSVVQEEEENANVVKELRLAISQLDTINPIISKNKHVQEISKIIFDPLISYDENYSKEYCLATEVSKVDDLTYLIKLRENVKWSDGSDFKAEDVRYTLGLLKNIDSI